MTYDHVTIFYTDGTSEKILVKSLSVKDQVLHLYIDQYPILYRYIPLSQIREYRTER